MIDAISRHFLRSDDDRQSLSLIVNFCQSLYIIVSLLKPLLISVNSGQSWRSFSTLLSFYPNWAKILVRRCFKGGLISRLCSLNSK